MAKLEKEEEIMAFLEMMKSDMKSAAEEMSRFFRFIMVPETACCLCCYDTGGIFFCK